MANASSARLKGRVLTIQMVGRGNEARGHFASSLKKKVPRRRLNAWGRSHVALYKVMPRKTVTVGFPKHREHGKRRCTRRAFWRLYPTCLSSTACFVRRLTFFRHDSSLEHQSTSRTSFVSSFRIAHVWQTNPASPTGSFLISCLKFNKAGAPPLARQFLLVESASPGPIRMPV